MYENSQWRVTVYGLEALDGNRREYSVGIAKLIETREDAGGLVYEFLVDLGLKTWIIPELLLDAYERALVDHAERLPRPFDPGIWDRSKAMFWSHVARTRADPTEVMNRSPA
jgi:hypothetical protein